MGLFTRGLIGGIYGIECTVLNVSVFGVILVILEKTFAR